MSLYSYFLYSIRCFISIVSRYFIFVNILQIRKFISVNTIAKTKEGCKGVNRIEKGSSTVSIEYVCSIAKALNVTPQDILCSLIDVPLHSTGRFFIKTNRYYIHFHCLSSDFPSFSYKKCPLPHRSFGHFKFFLLSRLVQLRSDFLRLIPCFF